MAALLLIGRTTGGSIPVEVFIVIRFRWNNILCASLTVIIIHFVDSVDNWCIQIDT